MTQSKSQQYALAKRQISTILTGLEGASRLTAQWEYPPPPNATIDAARAQIASLLDDTREQLLIIDTEINVLYDAELP
jgi:hypothetical protein